MQEAKIADLSAEWQELYARAVVAREHSYSTYSHFAVGAAVLTASKRIYGGCNVENASYGLCICAERTAMFSAVASGERDLEAICVVADTTGPISPCGACRQVMSEFAVGTVILANMRGDALLTTVEELLPYGFEL